MTDTDLRARELELEYRSFLDDEATDGYYKSKVEDMIKRGETRLIVKINDARRNPNFKARADGLIQNSVEELVAFQRALKEYVISLDPTFGRSQFEFHIGLCGSFGSRHVTPRTLTSKFMNNTVCIEGIVSRASLVKPKMLKAAYFCPETGKKLERRYYDLTSLEYHPTSNILETKDEDGHIVELEYGYSIYKNHQTVVLQEMPEVAPAGQLPRCTEVVLPNDLVDSCKPGDRVQIVGSYRCLPYKQGAFSTCVFRTVVIANYVEQMSKEVHMAMSDQDVVTCKRLSRTRKINVVNRLADSLAPTIYGHEHVKKAILLQLLGGLEKTLYNGSRLRGDINVLLMGDPSVAKSQLLRYVLNIAPRAIATTGRGSSGVGLTAAVTTDPDTGDRRLEAGAMVLADRGIVCVDEFDKMSDIDRTAIHEVMEQGRVSICKAGIQARLNARCSVLAAANPVAGKYDECKLPMENIGMQDSLLSRFDLLFILLDKHDTVKDRRIAEFVIKIQRYRPTNELDGEPTVLSLNANYLSTMQEENESSDKTQMFQKHNPLLNQSASREKRLFTVDFLRKYIYFASKVKPELTKEAGAMLIKFYEQLRSDSNKKVEKNQDSAMTQPITARSFETMVRLSTAHAKARLSNLIEEVDAAAAINLLQISCFQKVEIKARARSRPKKVTNEDDEEISEASEDDEDTMASKRYIDDDDDGDTTSKRQRLHDEGGDENMAVDDNSAKKSVEFSADEIAEIVNRLPEFEKVLNDVSRRRQGATVIDCNEIYQEAYDQMGFSEDKSGVLLRHLESENKIVVDNNSIYFV